MSYTLPETRIRGGKIIASLPEIFVREYIEYSRRLMEKGWSCYLLTFLFNSLPEMAAIRQKLIEDEIYRVYKKALMWSVKYPKSPKYKDILPIWICCPDWQIPKEHRRLEISGLNGGLHYGGLAFQSPACRLERKGGLDHHIAERGTNYQLEGKPLLHLHAKRVIGDPEAAVAYTFKSLLRGRSQIYEMVKFPLAPSELKGG